MSVKPDSVLSESRYEGLVSALKKVVVALVYSRLYETFALADFDEIVEHIQGPIGHAKL